MDILPVEVVSEVTKTPHALFIGVSQDPRDIIKSMTKIESSEEFSGTHIEDNVESFPWTLDNKYYKAEINLSILHSKIITTPEFTRNVEAIILCIDTNESSCLTDAEAWLPYIKDYNTSIEMLVCKSCSDQPDANPNRSDVFKWCLLNEFELVELEQNVDDQDESDFEDDMRDVFGIERISQALNAHVWPNLVRKDRSEPTSFNALKSGGSLHEEIISNFESCGEIEIEDKINELLAGGTPDMEFCELFQELANMKEKIHDMPTERRKKCAEQIVMAFWNGIGGDEDELGNLDEDEDK